MEDTEGFAAVVMAMMEKMEAKNYVKFKMLNFII